MMLNDLDPDPYLESQGHMRHLKVTVNMLVSALYLRYALVDYHLTCPKITKEAHFHLAYIAKRF